MNAEKLEGTLILDGLLEGRVPSDGGAARLREWVNFAASLGLRFSLEVEGQAFSLLADNRPIQVESLRSTPSKLVEDSLGELLKVFAPEERARLFSTLRSIEYRKGLEVQTLFVIGADGRIDVREEAVAAATKAPPRPLTGKEKLRLAAAGLGIAALIFAVSALFVDYGALWDTIRDAVVPMRAANVEVDAKRFESYFSVEEKKIGRGGRTMVLTLKRTDAFPGDDAAIERAMQKAGTSVSARLALEALAKGYVRCEFFDRKNEFLGFAPGRIRKLRVEQIFDLSVPMPRRRRPARIVITY